MPPLGQKPTTTSRVTWRLFFLFSRRRDWQTAQQEDELEEVHEEAAQQGQSDQIAREEKINTHFVCLT